MPGRGSSSTPYAPALALAGNLNRETTCISNLDIVRCETTRRSFTLMGFFPANSPLLHSARIRLVQGAHRRTFNTTTCPVYGTFTIFRVTHCREHIGKYNFWSPHTSYPSRLTLETSHEMAPLECLREMAPSETLDASLIHLFSTDQSSLYEPCFLMSRDAYAAWRMSLSSGRGANKSRLSSPVRIHQSATGFRSRRNLRLGRRSRQWSGQLRQMPYRSPLIRSFKILAAAITPFPV